MVLGTYCSVAVLSRVGLGKYPSPKSKRPAAHWLECHPDGRIYSPTECLWGVDTPFAGDAIHYADDVVFGRCFCLKHVSVAEEGDGVLVYSDDSVDEVVAVGVTYEGYCSFLQVFLFPWTEGHLVAQVNHERIHAVAFDCDVYCLAFIYEGSDLLHHDGFVYGYCLCLIAHCSYLGFLLPEFLRLDILCKSTDIFRYL